MNKLIPLIIFLLIATLSCTPPSSFKLEQHLRMNMGDDPLSLDPRQGNDVLTNNITYQLYEPLTTLDPYGNITLAGAESVSISEDQLVYTFTLRENYWSDGTPVKASDYAETWLSSLSPNFPAPHVYQLYPIKNAFKAKIGEALLSEVGIEAVDTQTLKITLETPAPYFLELTSGHMYFPVKNRTEIPYKGTITNGPFCLSKWLPQRELILKKQPYYWNNKEVHLKKITFFSIQNDIIELNMFENDEIDWAGAPLTHLPYDAIPELKQKNTVYEVPIAGIYWFKFNTQIEPFSNKKIRQAFSLAINRETLIKHIIQTQQIPATGIVPSIVKKENQTAFFKDADIPKAKRLFDEGLKELGLKKSNLPPLYLNYNTGNDHQRLAEAIQEQWHHTFGVQVQLRNTEWKVHLDNVTQKNFQIGRLSWVGDFLDPLAFLDQFKYKNSDIYGGNNDTGWENPKYIELIDKASASANPEERSKYLEQAEQLFLDEMPVIPLYYITLSYIKKNYVQGAFISPLGKLELRSAYIQKESHKKEGHP